MNKKRAFISVFVIFLISISFVSAIEIKSDKQVFSQGETFFATLEGNILEAITKEDVGFYIGHVQKPFNYDIAKIGSKYYIYTIVPYSEQNYTLKIKDVYYKENNQFITQDLELNFSVSNTQADFYVNKGFIITNKDFEIILYNNLNNGLILSYSFENLTKEISLPPQEEKKLKINITSILTTKNTILEISSQNTKYTIPVQIIRNQSFSEIEIIGDEDEGSGIVLIIGKPEIKFSLNEINSTLNKEEVYSYDVKIMNIGDKDSGKINLFVEGVKNIANLSSQSIENLAPGEERSILVTVSSKKKGDFSGMIRAISEETSDEIKLKIIIGEKVSIVSSVRGEKTCADLNGKICSSGQICEGINVLSLDSVFCCTGVCSQLTQQETKKSSNTWAIVIVVILLLVIIGFIFLKMRKSKSSNPLDEKI